MVTQLDDLVGACQPASHRYVALARLVDNNEVEHTRLKWHTPFCGQRGHGPAGQERGHLLLKLFKLLVQARIVGEIRAFNEAHCSDELAHFPAVVGVDIQRARDEPLVPQI